MRYDRYKILSEIFTTSCSVCGEKNLRVGMKYVFLRAGCAAIRWKIV